MHISTFKICLLSCIAAVAIALPLPQLDFGSEEVIPVEVPIHTAPVHKVPVLKAPVHKALINKAPEKGLPRLYGAPSVEVSEERLQDTVDEPEFKELQSSPSSNIIETKIPIDDDEKKNNLRSESFQSKEELEDRFLNLIFGEDIPIETLNGNLDIEILNTFEVEPELEGLQSLSVSSLVSEPDTMNLSELKKEEIEEQSSVGDKKVSSLADNFDDNIDEPPPTLADFQRKEAPGSIDGFIDFDFQFSEPIYGLSQLYEIPSESSGQVSILAKPDSPEDDQDISGSDSGVNEHLLKPDEDPEASDSDPSVIVPLKDLSKTNIMVGMPFAFDWQVEDEIEENLFSHRANSNGLITTGEYSVLLPDGRLQVVRYWDRGDGYNVDIIYQ